MRTNLKRDATTGFLLPEDARGERRVAVRRAVPHGGAFRGRRRQDGFVTAGSSWWNRGLSYPQLVLQDNPTYFWQMNEASGAATVINYGSAGSSANLPSHATLGATPLIAGYTCASFNGTSQYIGAVTLSIPQPPLTYSAIISTPNGGLLFGPYSNAGTGGITFDANATNGTIHVSWAGDGRGVASNTGIIAANTKYHIAFTYASVGGTYVFYINGVAQGTGTYTANPSGTAQTTLGCFGTAFQYFYQGSFSMFAIHPTVLSAARIAQYYAASGI